MADPKTPDKKPAAPKPAARRGRGRPKWKPTKAELEKVELLARIGRPQKEIAEVIGVDAKTMRDNEECSRVLRFGKIEATAAVGGKLYEQAMAGNMAAIIFWMKSQAGWSEKTTVEHTGRDGGPIEIDMGAFKELLRGKSPEEVAEIERTIRILLQFGGIGEPSGAEADARRDSGAEARS